MSQSQETPAQAAPAAGGSAPRAARATPSAPQADRNWYGVVALVTSLVGMSLLGVVFGALGLGAVKNGRASNRTMSLAGLIIGIVGLLAAAAAVLVAVLGARTASAEARDQEARTDVEAIFYGVQQTWPIVYDELDINTLAWAPGVAAQEGSYVVVGGLSGNEDLGYTVAAQRLPDSAHPSLIIHGPTVDEPLNITCITLTYSGGTTGGVHYTSTGGFGEGTLCSAG